MNENVIKQAAKLMLKNKNAELKHFSELNLNPA
jgi:hypothetical protein